MNGVGEETPNASVNDDGGCGGWCGQVKLSGSDGRGDDAAKLNASSARGAGRLKGPTSPCGTSRMASDDRAGCPSQVMCDDECDPAAVKLLDCVCGHDENGEEKHYDGGDGDRPRESETTPGPDPGLASVVQEVMLQDLTL